jgi:membrane protease YdiL (CAAX protease family)
VIPVDPSDSTGKVPIHSEDTRAVFLPEDYEDVPEVLPAPPPPHPNFWWALLWCLGFVFVTQIVGGFIGLIVIVFWEIVQTPNPEIIRANLARPQWLYEVAQRSSAALVFVVEVLVIGFSFLVVRFVVGKNWKRRLAFRRPSVSHFVLVLLGFPGLLYLADGAYRLAKYYLPSMHDFGLLGMEDWVTQFQTWSAALAVLLIGVGPGIGEELWCRGFLGRGLVGTYGIVPGVLLSSLFFGVIHLDPQQATMAFFMGICLHFVYLTSRSLLLAMFLHFFNNSVSVLLPRVWTSENAPTPENVPLILYVGSIFLLAAVGWAMYHSRVRLLVFVIDQPPWRPDYPGVEYPPAGSSTVVWRPWPGWQASGIVLAGVLIFALSIYLAPMLVIP